MNILMTPYAWAKWHFLARMFPHEIGAMALTHPENALLVEDFVLPKQQCSGAYCEFDDDGLADVFDKHVGPPGSGLRNPHNIGRIWMHTHPAGVDGPSVKDEETFATKFGNTDWAVMLILTKAGVSYARLRVTSPHLPSINLTPGIELTHAIPFPAGDPEMWLKEVQEACRPYVVPPAVVEKYKISKVLKTRPVSHINEMLNKKETVVASANHIPSSISHETTTVIKPTSSVNLDSKESRRNRQKGEGKGKNKGKGSRAPTYYGDDVFGGFDDDYPSACRKTVWDHVQQRYVPISSRPEREDADEFGADIPDYAVDFKVEHEKALEKFGVVVFYNERGIAEMFEMEVEDIDKDGKKSTSVLKVPYWSFTKIMKICRTYGVYWHDLDAKTSEPLYRVTYKFPGEKDDVTEVLTEEKIEDLVEMLETDAEAMEFPPVEAVGKIPTDAQIGWNLEDPKTTSEKVVMHASTEEVNNALNKENAK